MGRYEGTTSILFSSLSLSLFIVITRDCPLSRYTIFIARTIRFTNGSQWYLASLDIRTKKRRFSAISFYRARGSFVTFMVTAEKRWIDQSGTIYVKSIESNGDYNATYFFLFFLFFLLFVAKAEFIELFFSSSFRFESWERRKEILFLSFPFL